LERSQQWHPWKEPENIRAFFDDFAREEGFDPLDPEAWHSVQPSKVAVLQVLVVGVLCSGVLWFIVMW